MTAVDIDVQRLEQARIGVSEALRNREAEEAWPFGALQVTITACAPFLRIILPRFQCVPCVCTLMLPLRVLPCETMLMRSRSVPCACCEKVFPFVSLHAPHAVALFFWLAVCPHA